MSGTSLDGMDIALCEITKRQCRCLAADTFAFDDALRGRLHAVVAQKTALEDYFLLSRDFSRFICDVTERFLHRYDIEKRAIAAAGIHGQTVWHAPDEAMSVQMLSPAYIAAKLGIDVVCDFRAKDVAMGGEGAPLAPLFHRLYFASYAKPLAVVNIGGIANITVIEESKIYGYDIGPGNVLTDIWIGRHLAKAYDDEGNWARSGKVIAPLLREMQADDFFARVPPKSTGREYFNEAWIDTMLERIGEDKNFNAADVQRTLLELTAATIAEAIERSGAKEAIICGGGAHNRLLTERIASSIAPVTLRLLEEADFLEAMMMAWLAYKRVRREPIDLRAITGGGNAHIAGAWYAGK